MVLYCKVMAMLTVSERRGIHQVILYLGFIGALQILILLIYLLLNHVSSKSNSRAGAMQIEENMLMTSA